MTAIMLPYDSRNEVFCPKCNSLGTVYVPSRRFGHCNECGFEWTFPPYRKPSTRTQENGGR